MIAAVSFRSLSMSVLSAGLRAIQSFSDPRSIRPPGVKPSAAQWAARSIRPLRGLPCCPCAHPQTVRCPFAYRLDGPALTHEKETHMSNSSQTTKPLFRVAFSRFTGKDDEGRDQLSRPNVIRRGILTP